MPTEAPQDAPTTTSKMSKRAKMIGATLTAGAVLASAGVASADSGGGLLGGLLGGVGKTVEQTTTGVGGLLGNTVAGLDATIANTLDELTGLLSNALNPLGEFSNTQTGTPISRSDLNKTIGASAYHAAGIDGAGIDIAMIDTGVAPVGGLAGDGVVLNGPDLSLDYQDGLAAGVDGFGHGTHLAGIAVGRDGGVAPGSRLVNIKTGASDGAVDVSQVIAAIDWVVAHKNDAGLNIRVLLLAYGTDSTVAAANSPLAHAVESAWRNGIVVVVSAGNSGKALVHPANDPHVITVGGMTPNNINTTLDDKIGTYSSVGTKARGVDILAPGTSIWSTRAPGSLADTSFPKSRSADGQFLRGTGTSQAAAVAAGSAALILDSRPELTPDQVKAVLVNSGRKLVGPAANAQGGGVVDLGRAAFTLAPPSRAQAAFSTGTGSLEATRGSNHLVSDSGAKLSGEVDILGAPWNGATWAPQSTAGTAWTGGVWNGNQWAGEGWTTGDDGEGWNARSWRGDTWSARSWRSASWNARSWRADVWAARSWRSESWASKYWDSVTG